MASFVPTSANCRVVPLRDIRRVLEATSLCRVPPAGIPADASTSNADVKRSPFLCGIKITKFASAKSGPPCIAPKTTLMKTVVVSEMESDNKSTEPAGRPFKLLSVVSPGIALTAAAAAAGNPEIMTALSSVPLSVPIAIGMAIGMEWVARYLHGEIWHKWLYWVHESHHQPRQGPFEFNDSLSLVNAPIAIAMIYYGDRVDHGIAGQISLGLGVGMTMFGVAYILVHDGYCHRRLPLEWIGKLPYMKDVRKAHLVHHGENLGEEPYGLFLGPQELEKVADKKQHLKYFWAKQKEGKSDW
mmetsp:Transcript_19925/g.34281  ORF Transcript_19925/g.34281 Transcript_19925/m.34281 type:complete len:300 (+) Transcript_19925:135-1034(+)|eukprot:CAMPEP_0196655912 /NCGR_PEP_ID=MMETSP1086-20130531/10990_1 /TAXON_ID=77921 /ORGANISM="Cyanoptyche  gloeocystis , Strain SAG4.97" /LENGTH=299 /DNA_ID=CAMNT_0041988451 /DNA_START=135 /DNA_END=1031 /DNA_ORIENTATION=+